MKVYLLSFLLPAFLFSRTRYEDRAAAAPKIDLVVVPDSSFETVHNTSRIYADGGYSTPFESQNKIALNGGADYSTYFLVSDRRTDTLTVNYRRDVEYVQEDHNYVVKTSNYSVSYHTFDSVKVINNVNAGDYGTIYLYY